MVVGDLKAATTSLHFYLSQHPDIFMPAQKELRYFAFDRRNPYHRRARSTKVRSWSEYLAQYAGAHEPIVGEACPNYLKAPGAAERIRRKLPEARIVVSLRNPADRLYSAYQMAARAGNVAPFDTIAFRDNAIFVRGNFYAPALREYYSRFEHVHVLTTEQLRADFPGTLACLYRFVGADPGFAPDPKPKNTGGVPRNRAIYSALMAIKDAARSALPRPPAAIAGQWRKLEARSLTKGSGMSEETRRCILEICRDDIEETASVTGLDLSAWHAECP